MTISQQLRDAIRNSGMTAYRISQDSKVAEPILSHFLSADPKKRRDIRLETAAKIAELLQLELRPKAAKRRTRKIGRK